MNPIPTKKDLINLILSVLGLPQRPTGPDATKYLRGDGTWTVPPAGGGGTPSATVASETSFGISSNAGASTDYSRGDHTHGSPTDPVPAHVAAANPHTGYQLRTEKAAASGYASLDGSIKVPVAQLPTLDLITAPAASVNFNGQQATSFRVENRSSDPGSPTTGQIWLRTDL
jgi:hypothetical protein